MKRGVTASLLLVAAALLHADQYSDLFREAADYAQQKKFDEAIAKYKAALAIRPGAPEALNNLAVMYYELRKYSDAFDTASSIWASHPELKSAALIAGMSAVQCNRPKDAIAPLNRLLESDPRNRDALLALASARLALREFSAAAGVYERETAYSPDDTTAWYGRAICYETLAESASKRLSQMSSAASYSKRLLAEYLQNAGDSKLAQEAFGESSATSSESSAEAVKQYEIARDLAQKSRKAFEQLVTIAPDSWQAAIFLGDVDRQHGDLRSAIARYQKAAEQQPGQPAPLLGLGTAYWELGNFDRAASYLRQTLALNPNASQAVFELANIAVRRHADSEAIPLLKEYLAQQPDALAAHADLGRAYSHLGKYEEAALELSKAAAADERGDIHYLLAIVLKKLGRTQEAQAALNKSTAIRQAQLAREQRLHSDR
jgi:tetratricopeptide (TPR) repeat protein